MAVTFSTLSHWFDEGVRLQHRWMLVIVDTFDDSASPLYFDENRTGEARAHAREPGNMQRCEEVYDLQDDKLVQLRKRKSWAFARERVA